MTPGRKAVPLEDLHILPQPAVLSPRLSQLRLLLSGQAPRLSTPHTSRCSGQCSAHCSGHCSAGRQHYRHDKRYGTFLRHSVARTSREEVNHMCVHPAMLSELAASKRRDMLAQAEQDRRAKQLAVLARAERRAERARLRMPKAARLSLRLRSELSE